MPYAASGGVKLYFEEAGQGHPVIFAHEFAGDHRSWEHQMRRFSRDYHCIAFSAVGYPPSDVPDDESLYDYRHQVENIAAVMRHLGLAKAHIVGLSMGAYSALQFGVLHPEMASALVVAGCGSGAPREHQMRFKAESEAMAARLEREGMARVAVTLASTPTRIPYQNKDPRGWAEFKGQLAQHSNIGSAKTLRRFQAPRPSLWDFESQFAALKVPVLLLLGDEDEPCIEANVFLKRAIPTAGLVVVPNTGHLVNLEEPDIFNDAVASFLAAAERRTWPTRDPRSKSAEVFPEGKS
jgi:pimeloyl-ACP methyl ester carboxylesterase